MMTSYACLGSGWRHCAVQPRWPDSPRFRSDIPEKGCIVRSEKLWRTSARVIRAHHHAPGTLRPTSIHTPSGLNGGDVAARGTHRAQALTGQGADVSA